MFPQVPGEQSSQMLPRAGSLADGMSPVRIRHVLKVPVVFNQLIHQHFGIIKMHVIVGGPMNIQQVPPQVTGIRDGRTF